MRPSLVHIDVLPRPQAKALRLALGLEEGRLSHPRRAVQPARQAPAEAVPAVRRQVPGQRSHHAAARRLARRAGPPHLPDAPARRGHLVTRMTGRRYLDPGDRLSGRLDPPRPCRGLARWGPGRPAHRARRVRRRPPGRHPVPAPPQDSSPAADRARLHRPRGSSGPGSTTAKPARPAPAYRDHWATGPSASSQAPPPASAGHGIGCTWRITRDEWLNAKG
jgi:hypothetical protein